MTLEEETERLIAYHFLTKVTGNLSDRARRMYEKLGSEIAHKLKSGNRLPEKSSLVLELKWSDEAIAWARKISLALKEFEQVNPVAYKQLEKIREKHRNTRRDYIEFGGDIEDIVYKTVIMDTLEGLNPKDAEMFYKRLKIIYGILIQKKKEENLYRFLLPE